MQNFSLSLNGLIFIVLPLPFIKDKINFKLFYLIIKFIMNWHPGWCSVPAIRSGFLPQTMSLSTLSFMQACVLILFNSPHTALFGDSA
jgi:hypothetical protein